MFCFVRGAQVELLASEIREYQNEVRNTEGKVLILAHKKIMSGPEY